MTHIWQGLRSGEWLTAARARGYSLILLGLYAVAMAGWIAVSDGLIDRNGMPIGTDFSSFYAPCSLVLDGRSNDVYDMAPHYAREQQICVVATTVSARPHCLYRPCSRCQLGRSSPASCLASSPTTRNLRSSSPSLCWPRAHGEPSLPPSSP